MNKPLLGQKIAVLVANGFSEKDLTFTQKVLMHSGAQMRIVSMDPGLVNSWNDDAGQEGWGLNFASDQVLNQALAADYDMLIVPGGQRSVEKLELTAHTRRFIGGFVDAGKPVAIYGNALQVLLFAERGEGVRVCGPEALREKAESQGASWCEDVAIQSGHVLSGRSDTETREAFTQTVIAFFIEQSMPEAVAA